MSSLRRGISRVILLVVNKVVVPVELISPRKYMRFYTWFLKRFGVSFTGVPRYISSRVLFDDFSLITIGERVVLSKFVILLTHDYSVTTGLIAIGMTPPTDVSINRPIVIGNNVFIGMNSIVMPGTIIEDNVIVGAGSVLRGLVEADSIMLGNPAVKIGRLSDNPERWLERSRGEYALADT